MPSTTNLVGASTRKVMPSGRLDQHRVAEAERELEVRALGLHAVTDADDLQRLAVPSVTPVTMLAISVRVRPCSARTLPSSLGLVTLIRRPPEPPSIGSATVSASVPLGPLTVTAWPSIVDVDPAGDGDGQTSDA